MSETKEPAHAKPLKALRRACDRRGFTVKWADFHASGSALVVLGTCEQLLWSGNATKPEERLDLLARAHEWIQTKHPRKVGAPYGNKNRTKKEQP